VFLADETAARTDAARADVVARYVREVEKTLTDLAKTIAVRLETDKNVAVDATKATLADMELERMLMDALDDSALDDSALDDSALDDCALDDSALDDCALDDSALNV